MSVDLVCATDKPKSQRVDFRVFLHICNTAGGREEARRGGCWWGRGTSETAALPANTARDRVREGAQLRGGQVPPALCKVS